MAKTRFTAAQVSKYPAPTHEGPDRLEYRDEDCPGLVLRVTRRGTRTYFVRYGRRTEKIGRVGQITVSEARSIARVIVSDLIKGVDRKAKKFTFADAVNEYRVNHIEARKLKSAKNLLSYLNRHFIPSLSSKLLSEIVASDIDKVTDALLRSGKCSEANHAFTTIRGLFNFCKQRGLISSAPTDGKRQPAKHSTRERVLTEDELTRVWKATGRLGPFDILARLILLTGARRSEISQASWTEFDPRKKALTIPWSRTKNGRPHPIPLSKPALDLLNLLKRRSFSSSPYLFPSGGDKHPTISGFSRGMRSIRNRSGVSDFSYHDLRRTTASVLLEQGTSPVVIQRILNHSYGPISGVTATYARGNLFPDMRKALDKFGSYIESLDQSANPKPLQTQFRIAPALLT